MPDAVTEIRVAGRPASAGGPGVFRRTTAWFVRFARRKPLGMICLFILLILCITAIFAPVIAPYAPSSNLEVGRLHEPTFAHPMGTDAQSRDLFSRVVYGTRLSLSIAFLSVAVGTIVGSAVGIISGYFGGTIDFLIQRVVDVMMAMPILILAIAMVAMLGQSVTNVVIALAVAQVPGTSRVVRSSVLAVRQETYVEAARATGASHFRITMRHVLPNIMAPILILATTALGWAIIAETSLSFLGLGPPVTIPSWGQMISGDARLFMLTAWWLPTFPGLAITLAVFSVNMLGDAIRDELDPRLRSG